MGKMGKRKSSSSFWSGTRQWGGGGGGGGLRGGEGREIRFRERERVYLLFKIYGVRTVGSCRSKRRSWSTRQGLRVSTRIRGF